MGFAKRAKKHWHCERRFMNSESKYPWNTPALFAGIKAKDHDASTRSLCVSTCPATARLEKKSVEKGSLLFILTLIKVYDPCVLWMRLSLGVRAIERKIQFWLGRQRFDPATEMIDWFSRNVYRHVLFSVLNGRWAIIFYFPMSQKIHSY